MNSETTVFKSYESADPRDLKKIVKKRTRHENNRYERRKGDRHLLMDEPERIQDIPKVPWVKRKVDTIFDPNGVDVWYNYTTGNLYIEKYATRDDGSLDGSVTNIIAKPLKRKRMPPYCKRTFFSV